MFYIFLSELFESKMSEVIYSSFWRWIEKKYCSALTNRSIFVLKYRSGYKAFSQQKKDFMANITLFLCF